MIQDVICFAHSNGFPGKVYNGLYRILEDDFQIIFPEMLAHNPKYPVVSGWEKLADELIEFISQNSTTPVVGCGHSFGASITFMAAIKRPDLFKRLILIEPIMFNGFAKFVIAFFKWINYTDRFTPAGKSKFRKQCWADRDEAETYFRSKSLFKNFDERCLQDYLDHGLIQKEELCLRFQVKNEVEIFRTGPHHLDRYKGVLKSMPGVVITADQSDATAKSMIKRFTGQHDFEWKRIDGSHLFPLEQLELTAELIKEYATGFSTGNP